MVEMVVPAAVVVAAADLWADEMKHFEAESSSSVVEATFGVEKSFENCWVGIHQAGAFPQAGQHYNPCCPEFPFVAL